MSCYICWKQIQGVSHFNDLACPLYSGDDLTDRPNVRTAGTNAEQRAQRDLGVFELEGLAQNLLLKSTLAWLISSGSCVNAIWCSWIGRARLSRLQAYFQRPPATPSTNVAFFVMVTGPSTLHSSIYANQSIGHTKLSSRRASDRTSILQELIFWMPQELVR